jgi:hypothetical protein
MKIPSTVCTLLASALVACSASAPPPRPQVVADKPIVQEKVDPGPSYMESEIGGLNHDAMDDSFTSLQRPLQSCLEDGLSRVSELGGHFKLSLRIDRQGATRWVHLSESTLGDRDTEKCVIELARNKTWPRPLGGEGLAEKSFDIDPRAEPISWEEKRVRRALSYAHGALARCRRGVPGHFVATAYVRPDGRVLSAGVATPHERGEEAADCLVDTIRKLRFGSPGRRAAKVSFELPEI